MKLVGGIWETTMLLIDFVIVFAASSLARYYLPAWREILSAEATAVYNDIRAAYETAASRVPYFFQEQQPFQDSFKARIVPE